jgi:hypothetical protein
MTTTVPTLDTQDLDPASWRSPITGRPLARRRIRGLRLPALPSWALTSQVGGAAACLLGVYREWGLAVTLIVGGISAVLVGALKEAGKI